MAGEDQERFEDYLELERYIEELQAGHVAHPPADLTPERARVYRMAALFRSASPEAAEPSPEFAASLHARLLGMDEEHQQDLPQVAAPEPPAQDKREIQPPPITPKRARFVPRRSLLAGGAAAAASLLIGAGLGAAIEQGANKKEPNVAATTNPYAGTPLVPDTIPTKLHLVTTLTELGNGAVLFKADALVGYVIRGTGDDNWARNGEVIAMSAACTHMGCIVQWQDSDRRFHCPCHGGLFTADGDPDKSGHMKYLASLPRLETVIKDDNVYVKVPAVNAL